MSGIASGSNPAWTDRQALETPAVATIRLLYYLLILLLPVQLGQHFFFAFSLISGVRSDYLAPTVYATDILAGGLIASYLVAIVTVSSLRPSRGQLMTVVGIAFYLIATSLLVTANPWAALYRSSKLLEWLVVGYIAVRSRPRVPQIILFLSVAVFSVSLIAVGQFFRQQSLGEWGWFIGERTFSVSTPGIATMTLGGAKVLRAYGTFPHPNVLGGFLAIALVLIGSQLRKRKRKNRGLFLWYLIVWFLGAIALSDTGSRTAWTVMIVGCLGLIFPSWWRWVRGNVRFWTAAILMAVIGTAFIPLVWTSTDLSLAERARLTGQAVALFLQHPILGAGVNTVFPKTAPFQPVHHVMLLLFAETGLIGGGVCVWLLVIMICRSVQFRRLAAIIALQWVCLGMFDHYLITLQQGLMLTMLVVSLVFLPQNSYTDNTYEAA